jgi:hypothetical protein
VQDAFDFDLHPGRIELPGERYQLPNGTYDLDKAVTEIAEIASLAKPLILFTSLPYGDREAAEEPDCAYFSDLDFDAGVAIVSTHLWDPSRHPAGLQPYVLVQLSSAVLSYLAGLPMHYETKGCQFDYCENVEDIYRVLEGTGLCRACEHHLQKQLKDGAISNF